MKHILNQLNEPSTCKKKNICINNHTTKRTFTMKFPYVCLQDYETFYEAVENEALDAFLKCDSSQVNISNISGS